ncbi:hypothetical protein J6590_003051, partial [Homalodisca vitripennis]
RMTLSPAVKQIGVCCAETVVHDSCLRSSSNEDKKGIRFVILLQLPCLVILFCLTRMTLSPAVKQIGVRCAETVVHDSCLRSSNNEDKKGIRLVILLQLQCLVILVCLTRMTLSPAVKQIGVRFAETVVHDSCLRSSNNEDKKGIRLVILLQLPCLVILVCLTRMTLSPAVKQIGVRCAETVVHDSCLRSSNNEDKKGIRLVILLQLPCLVILVCLTRMTLSPAVKQIGVRCAEAVVHDSCLRSSNNEDKKGIRLVILLQLPCLVILVCLTRMTLSPAVKQIGVAVRRRWS